MSRLRLAMTALVLAVFAGVVGTHILISPAVVSADIGGGRVGPRGATGRTGPTGPNWTTCAELASSMTNEVGTCGSLGGPLLSASPTTTGTLTAAGISAVTGVFNAGLTTQAVGITGLVSITGTSSGTTIGALTVSPGDANTYSIIARSGLNSYAIRGCGNGTSTACGHLGEGGNTNADGVVGQGMGSGSGGDFAGGSSGSGITALSSSIASAAVFTNSSNGRAANFVSDTTSPQYGSILLTAQDSNPSASCTIGDLYVLSGGYLRTCTNTSPVWNDVAGFLSVTTGVTAFAGGGQASATAICASAAQTTVATVASAGDSVKFPATPVVGQICRVKNKGANSLDLFPGSGDAICNSGSACGAANAALAVAANAQVDCYAESAATWNCK